MNGSCPVMRPNVGNADRIIRIVIGMIALVSGSIWLTGPARNAANIVATVALITGMNGFCGLYAMTGLSTKPKKSK